MRYWEDLPLEEIGKAMDKTPDAVAGLLYRGMKVLRSELGA
jgi:DNA-directed RNA polymerase specialized sigma24 family protein